MRFLFVELILPLLLLLFVRSIFRSLFQNVRSVATPQAPPRPSPPSVPLGGELRKDPVCGTYVSTIGTFSTTVNGQFIYFCSAACRDKYRAA